MAKKYINHESESKDVDGWLLDSVIELLQELQDEFGYSAKVYFNRYSEHDTSFRVSIIRLETDNEYNTRRAYEASVEQRGKSGRRKQYEELKKEFEND